MSSVTGMLWLTVAVNVVLASLKVAAGFLGGAATLVASGLHSFGDVLSSLVALAGTHVARRQGHTLGDGRSSPETLASVAVAITLLGIAWELTLYLQSPPGELALSARPAVFTLVVAALSMVVKESLCRWLRAWPGARNHALIDAVAFHQRADGLASGFVFLTLLATRSGGGAWSHVDLMGALVIAIYVGATGLAIFLRALENLDPRGLGSDGKASGRAASLVTLLAAITLAVGGLDELRLGRAPAWAETLIPAAMAVAVACLGMACRDRENRPEPAVLPMLLAVPAAAIALRASLPDVEGRLFWVGRLDPLIAGACALGVVGTCFAWSLLAGEGSARRRKEGLIVLGSLVLLGLVFFPPAAAEAFLDRLLASGAPAPGMPLPRPSTGLFLLLGLALARLLPRGRGRLALAAGLLSLTLPHLGLAWTAALFLLPAWSRNEEDLPLLASRAFATAVLGLALGDLLGLPGPLWAAAGLVVLDGLRVAPGGDLALGPKAAPTGGADALEARPEAGEAGFSYEDVFAG